MRACPSCRRRWSGSREVCPRCLATLVDDPDATVTCGQCGHAAPSRMRACPRCFAILRSEDADLLPLLTHGLAEGNPIPRPPSFPPFAAGHASTVLRLGARTPLVLAGPNGFVEATITGIWIAAQPPLRASANDELLFTLETYSAASSSLVALGRDGAPMATFLRRRTLRAEIEIRDHTTAPVARVSPERELVETGGRVLGELVSVDAVRDGWVDDQWTVSLAVAEPEVPLRPMALAALSLAAKVLLGRSVPVRSGEPSEPDPQDLFA